MSVRESVRRNLSLASTGILTALLAEEALAGVVSEIELLAPADSRTESSPLPIEAELLAAQEGLEFVAADVAQEKLPSPDAASENARAYDLLVRYLSDVLEPAAAHLWKYVLNR